jgi:hypothetical protein
VLPSNVVLFNTPQFPKKSTTATPLRLFNSKYFSLIECFGFIHNTWSGGRFVRAVLISGEFEESISIKEPPGTLKLDLKQKVLYNSDFKNDLSD